MNEISSLSLIQLEMQDFYNFLNASFRNLTWLMLYVVILAINIVVSPGGQVSNILNWRASNLGSIPGQGDL